MNRYFLGVLVAHAIPLFGLLLAFVGTPLLRNEGTVGRRTRVYFTTALLSHALYLWVLLP